MINVDLNVQRNLACIGIFEVDRDRGESKLYGIKFVNGELMRLVYKRAYLLEEIRGRNNFSRGGVLPKETIKSSGER